MVLVTIVVRCRIKLALFLLRADTDKRVQRKRRSWNLKVVGLRLSKSACDNARRKDASNFVP